MVRMISKTNCSDMWNLNWIVISSIIIIIIIIMESPKS